VRRHKRDSLSYLHVAVVGQVGPSRRWKLSVQVENGVWRQKSYLRSPAQGTGRGNSGSSTYLNLMVCDAARHTAGTRADAVRSIRELLHSVDLIEAQTPMLQCMHGRATARLFLMHSNAFDTARYLRIAACAR
jgi:lysyl-tRNA synthetase, class II